MSTSPDPVPEQTPGPEHGGGVRRGDTPPVESGTHGRSHREPTPPRWPNATTILLLLVVTLAVLGVIIAQVIGIIQVF
ncbi:DUF6480 family protein [Longimycelium tulufanense]|nr:DUF6480 family protein [Longimycelium tulufanense]